MPSTAEPAGTDGRARHAVSALAGDGPGWAAAALLGAAFVTLLLMEHRRPLRQRTRPPAGRWVRNALSGALAAAVVAAPNALVIRPATAAVEHRGWGLLPRLGLPPAVERGLALVLMDYTLYLWHILLHRLPFLWRWHRMHHADADLDVSTALRFHAAELAWSVPWRAAQVLLIGVRAPTLRLWGALTLGEVMFHHANLRLPHRLEHVLGWFVVTPCAHGVHHDRVLAHQHGNLSSGLAIWDRLHGTRVADVPQDTVVIGPPPGTGYRTGSSRNMSLGGQSQAVACQDAQAVEGAAPDPVVQEAARFGLHHLRQQHRGGVPAQALAQDHVLQHGHVGKAADPVEQRGLHEDRAALLPGRERRAVHGQPASCLPNA